MDFSIEKMTIMGILLAAGQSTRFGKDKLLYPLQNDIPMVVGSARTLRDAVDTTIAVVRPNSAILSTVLQGENVKTTICPQSIEGMGSSLACGVSASSNADAWVIALADMPFIQIETVHRLVALLRQGAPIVVPTIDGKYGHPVGFHRRFAPQLTTLSGDRGAKIILQRYATDIVSFPCEDKGIFKDIDKLQDLETTWKS